MRDHVEQVDAQQTKHDWKPAELKDRANGIRPPEGEGPTVGRGQRLGQREEAIDHVGTRHTGRDEERETGTILAEYSADDRPQQDEPEPERCSHKPEVLRAILGRAHVSDVGIGGHVAPADDARHKPPQEQPCDGGREPHERVVETVGCQ